MVMRRYMPTRRSSREQMLRESPEQPSLLQLRQPQVSHACNMFDGKPQINKHFNNARASCMADTCSCCKRWEEHIHLSWMKMMHKFHFFKVLLDDFSHHLSIPKKFVLLFQEKLPETVELKDPTGKRWHVKLKRADGCVFLEDGWQEFARDHSLEVGDFLVFRFNGDSSFKVLIFDISGCEKENWYSCEKQKKRSCCDETPVKGEGGENSAEIQLVSIPTRAIGFENIQATPTQPTNLEPCQNPSKLVCKDIKEENNFRKDAQEAPKQAIHRMAVRSRDEKVYPDEQDRSSEYRKRRGRSSHFSTRAGYTANGSADSMILQYLKPVPGERANSSRKRKYGNSYSQQFISNRRPVTEEEKNRAFQLASTVQLAHPAFMSIMKPSHVYRKFFLTVPIEFASDFFFEQSQRIMLHTTAGEWEVRCNQYNRIYGIYFGWKEFVTGNNLEEGDVLIFEFASRRSYERMNVRIFRVVEDIVLPTDMNVAQRRRRNGSTTHK